MARFDVHRHPLAKSRRSVPFLLSIQTDALDFLATRLVAPLVVEKAFGPRIPFLHPIVPIDGDRLVVAMNELVAVDRALLGAPVFSMRESASEIVAALDYLVSGY